MESHEQPQSTASTGDNLVSNSSDVASVLDKHDPPSPAELLSSARCSSDVNSGNTGADSTSTVRRVDSLSPSSPLPVSSHPVTSGNHERIEAILRQKRTERSKKVNNSREPNKVTVVKSTEASEALEVLKSEEKDLVISTGDVISKMQDELQKGLKFLQENQEQIVKAFHTITQCTRMTNNAEGVLNLCSMSMKQLSTYIPKSSSVQILHQACYYLGLLGRYRMSDKASEFFDQLIIRTGYIDHQANQALVNTILPSLSEAICNGSRALEIGVYQLPPSDSTTANFWNVFVCIRTTRKICETLELQGYTVKLSRTAGTSGSVLTKATISWQPEMLSPEEEDNQNL